MSKIQVKSNNEKYLIREQLGKLEIVTYVIIKI